jgi:hypothetical protein
LLAGGVGFVGVAVEGDGEFVLQQQLLDARVEVGGAFDEDGLGSVRADVGADAVGAGGAVVADAEDVDGHCLPCRLAWPF